jgi:hypothetical protein
MMFDIKSVSGDTRFFYFDLLAHCYSPPFQRQVWFNFALTLIPKFLHSSPPPPPPPHSLSLSFSSSSLLLLSLYVSISSRLCRSCLLSIWNSITNAPMSTIATERATTAAKAAKATTGDSRGGAATLTLQPRLGVNGAWGQIMASRVRFY